jgi:hypothetical protein
VNDIEQAEKAVLDAHEPKWVAQGYKVVRHPTGAVLPTFLESYAPDAVLLGRSPQVVVEVVRKGQPNVERKVRALNALLAEHGDWRLMLLYAGVEPIELPAVTTERLKTSLASVRQLAYVDLRSSLLLLWATLEALGRRLEPEKTKRPQKPASIVELLAAAGFIVPSEAEQLRRAADWRNRLVHGDLEIELAERQILDLAVIVEGLIDVLEKNDARSNSPDL